MDTAKTAPDSDTNRPANGSQRGGPRPGAGRPRTSMRRVIAGLERGNDPQATRVKNGSAIIPGAHQGSVYVRRFKELLSAYLSDIPRATTAERSILRRAVIIEIELERFESRFAHDDGATKQDLDLYSRLAGSLRRLLEAVGLERRPEMVKNLDSHLAAKRAAKQTLIEATVVEPAPTNGAVNGR